MLDGVFESEDTSLALGLVSDVRVLLTHTDHDALVTGATDDGREDGTGCVVTGEAGLAHAGAVVDYQRSNVVVTHFAKDRSLTREQRESLTDVHLNELRNTEQEESWNGSAVYPRRPPRPADIRLDFCQKRQSCDSATT